MLEIQPPTPPPSGPGGTPPGDPRAPAERALEARPEVLIVEDDPDILAQLTLAFEREGLRVRSAANGVQALKQLSSAPPAALVLDLHLPQINGFQVLDAMRASPRLRTVTVAAISAVYLDRQAVEQTFSGLERATFVPKPFSTLALARWVASQVVRDPLSEAALGRPPEAAPAAGAEPAGTVSGERRAARRVRTEVRALVQAPTGDVDVRVVDVSSRGFRLLGPRSIARVGEHIRLRLLLPTVPRAEARVAGRVIWVSPPSRPGPDGEFGIVVEVVGNGAEALDKWRKQVEDSVDPDPWDHWLE